MMELQLVDYLDHEDDEHIPYCDLCSVSSETVYLLSLSAYLQIHFCSECKDKLSSLLNVVQPSFSV